MIETGANPAICVEVVYALPGQTWSTPLKLPAGATAAQALALAMMAGLDGRIGPETLQMAVFGRMVEPGAKLRDGDRLELLRPLTMDPKQRRRVRASGAQAPKRS